MEFNIETVEYPGPPDLRDQIEAKAELAQQKHDTAIWLEGRKEGRAEMRKEIREAWQVFIHSLEDE